MAPNIPPRSLVEPVATPDQWTRPEPTTEPFETAPGEYAPAGITIRRGVAPSRPGQKLETESPQRRSLQTQTGLEAYVPGPDAPWTTERAIHLLSRTGYGVHADAIAAALEAGPSASVNALVDAVASMPAPPQPAWYRESFPPWRSAEYEVFSDAQEGRLREYQWGVYRACLGGDSSDPLERTATAFRERLALMWSNHFVTEHEAYYFSPFLARYWGLMRRHALGDFRSFVHDVGIDPAMLIYLNGWENQAGSPNENYARELLELFTMGITDRDGAQNYSQRDVEELSRALTGWSIEFQGDLEGVFYDDWHDGGTKTILGQTGPWSYEDIIPILFEARSPQIARFVCRMIYREFVYDVPDEGVVGEMATLFEKSDFQIDPVIRALLGSAHFFDAAVIRSRIKSPAERSFGLWSTLSIPAVRSEQGWMWYQMYLANQILFEPWNVAGWPGGRTWVDTSSLPIRWFVDGITLWKAREYQTLQPFALEAGAYEPRAFVRHAATLLLGREPDEQAVETYTGVLLDTIPEYEWDPTATGADIRIRALLEHLTRLPEFQLG
ncbi:DUF1800 domain-containing protein [Rubrivirga sp.]|uniref:DUF1800 domain-containing protein n=1 Tax=Rubrivirga sp. TaxID=1885344 RepID=UPI003C73D87F